MTLAVAAYLRRRVSARTAALTAFFVALMQILELMDVTTDVLDRGLGVRGLGYYAALRVPGELVLALPLAMLLGAMWAFYELARNHEIVAIRTAGVSVRRLAIYLLPVPFAVALAYAALSQAVVPQTEATLHAWWTATAPRDETPEPIWIRTSTGPVSYLTASVDGERLTGLRIYSIGEKGLLRQRISARSARWQQGAWHLEGVERLQVSAGQPEPPSGEVQVWETNLRPDDVLRAGIVRPKLSSIMLIGLVGGEHAASHPLAFYQTALYRSFVTPLIPFVMLLLALPAARALPRQNDGAAALLLALVLGLGFLLFDGFMAALGTSGRVSAILAAIAAPLLFAAIGLAQLLRAEGK
jgi:lipopolysaccharide export system permease protein